MARKILREEMVTIPRIDGDIHARMVWVNSGLFAEGKPIKMIQVDEVFDGDGSPLPLRELSQRDSLVAYDIARGLSGPPEEMPYEVTLTLRRPDQDITVALWRRFWRGQWETDVLWVEAVSGQREYRLLGLDEDGNQVEITQREAYALIVKADAGEDETGR